MHTHHTQTHLTPAHTHTRTHITHAHTSHTHTHHTRTHAHTSHTHTHHTRTHIIHAHTSHTHTHHTGTNHTHAHTHTPYTRTHTLSSHCVRRMVAHLCDEFKCLKGLTLPCVCTYLQYGETPLLLSARNGHIEVVRHLLSSGANVNKTNNVSVRQHWLW